MGPERDPEPRRSGCYSARLRSLFVEDSPCGLRPFPRERSPVFQGRAQGEQHREDQPAPQDSHPSVGQVLEEDPGPLRAVPRVRRRSGDFPQAPLPHESRRRVEVLFTAEVGVRRLERGSHQRRSRDSGAPRRSERLTRADGVREGLPRVRAQGAAHRRPRADPRGEPQ